MEDGGDYVQELALADGAAAQLEVDGDVLLNGGRVVEDIDVLRGGVDDRHELSDVPEVAQGLYAAGGGACPDGHQILGGASNLLDARRVVLRRDRPFHQGEIVRAPDGGPGGLQEVGDLHLLCDGEELVLAVKDRELAAVARGELPDGELGLAGASH